MAKRKTYDDEFRASAVLMLQAAGYPDTLGALSHVSKAIGVPSRTLRRWFTGENNPPPDNVVAHKKGDLREAIRNEIDAILTEMDKVRADTDYRTLGTVIGILIDKLQLLDGLPTSHNRLSGTGPKGSIPVVFTPFEDMNDDELDAFITENS